MVSWEEARAQEIQHRLPAMQAVTNEQRNIQVHVVILAGGFNQALVEEIVQTCRTDTLHKDSSSTLLRNTVSGVTHIPAGLMTIGKGGHGLAGTINHLYRAHQVSPLLQSLYMVTNACNHDEYGGKAGFFDDIGRFPREWQEKHVLCNGCSSPAEWKGHIADLLFAVQNIRAQGGAPLDMIVLDANLFIWPDFNMQKLVSAMVIRASNTIALQNLTDTYVNLAGSSVTLATPKTSSTVPAISSMHPRSVPQLGGLALAPMAYITAPTIEVAAGSVQQTGVRTIPQLFEALHTAGEQVYGVVLPWGVFDCSRQLTKQYSHECMLFHQRNNKAIPASPNSHKTSSDTILTLLQECDDTGLGRSKMYDREHANALMEQVMSSNQRDFDRYFFALHSSRFRGLQLPAYNLPSNFYMTEYRTRSCEAVL